MGNELLEIAMMCLLELAALELSLAGSFVILLLQVEYGKKPGN